MPKWQLYNKSCSIAKKRSATLIPEPLPVPPGETELQVDNPASWSDAQKVAWFNTIIREGTSASDSKYANKYRESKHPSYLIHGDWRKQHRDMTDIFIRGIVSTCALLISVNHSHQFLLDQTGLSSGRPYIYGDDARNRQTATKALPLIARQSAVSHDTSTRDNDPEDPFGRARGDTRQIRRPLS